MCSSMTLFLLCCSVYCPEIPLALLIYYEINVAQYLFAQKCVLLPLIEWQMAKKVCHSKFFWHVFYSEVHTNITLNHKPPQWVCFLRQNNLTILLHNWARQWDNRFKSEIHPKLLIYIQRHLNTALKCSDSVEIFISLHPLVQYYDLIFYVRLYK